jgi:F0F1-type ATP synthase membrane subunit a
VGGVKPGIPDEGLTLRHLAEMAVEWIDGLVTQVSELHEARRFVPFFGSPFLFILMANLMGLIERSGEPTYLELCVIVIHLVEY